MDKFYELETSLFKKEYLSDRKYLENIFCDNFMEYGKSGLTFYKEDTIEALFNSEDRDIKIEDFSSEQIDTKTYLIHYVSVNGSGERTNRTSIWIEDNGDLKLLFHQGTLRK